MSAVNDVTTCTRCDAYVLARLPFKDEILCWRCRNLWADVCPRVKGYDDQACTCGQCAP